MWGVPLGGPSKVLCASPAAFFFLHPHDVLVLRPLPYVMCSRLCKLALPRRLYTPCNCNDTALAGTQSKANERRFGTFGVTCCCGGSFLDAKWACRFACTSSSDYYYVYPPRIPLLEPCSSSVHRCDDCWERGCIMSWGSSRPLALEGAARQVGRL